MARYKVPSQAASGAETFSDALVGYQITTGSDQMTGTNFAVEKEIPEKDSKEFTSQPFSDYLTLDDINEEQSTSSTGNGSTKENDDVEFNTDKKNADRSLYGSLRLRLGVAVEDIILKYPAGVFVDNTSPVTTTDNTAENSTYDASSNTTEFTIQYSLIYNPLDVVMVEPESNTLPESDNEIRNFFSSYTKYVLEINGETYKIITYSEPDSDNNITLKVGGNPFGGTTGSTESYLIRPNNGIVENFFDELDDVQRVLLNRETKPLFKAGFNVPRDTNGGYSNEVITIYANWPLSRDGWNIQTEGVDYGYYINKLRDIGDEIDSYKSNLIIRFLTAPQLYEFDTDEHKMESIFQIYGQSFDEIRKFIDNVAYMRNVSYDAINNLPDVLLKNLCETLGFSTVTLFDEKSLEKSLYTRFSTQYDGISTGTNLVEAEYEFYRRILVNLAHLYKSKGTRKAIEFFLKFIGAPEPMIRLDEFIYNVNNTLPSKDVESDIADAMLGTKITNIMVYNTGTTLYDLVQYSGYTALSRAQYPVDESTGLPREIIDPTGDVFFQKGAGWYRKTLDHRSSDMIDYENSDLTSRVKVIKTKSKPFTYGEDYFDTYRQLPGLDYGYSLTAGIDNKKAEVTSTEREADVTMNRKNVNIFLSADRTIDYDIYRKSRDLNLTFGSAWCSSEFGQVTPQTGVTFAQFLDNILDSTIVNSNMVKYDRFYTGLTQIYYAYQNTGGYTPYHYVSVESFINHLGPYWMSIVDQFVPATTLWLGGNVIENGTFNRSKFKYRRPDWFDADPCDFTVSIQMIECAPSPSTTPSVTPSVTPSISVSVSPSVTPSISVSPTPSTSPGLTPTPTPTISVSPSLTPSATPTPSPTPQPEITLWAVGGDYITTSTDSGVTWTQSYSGSTTLDLRSVSFLNPNQGFAFGDSYAIKTVNGGAYWYDDSASLPAIVASRSLYGATHELSTHIYVGGNLSTFIRYNGSTWDDVSEGSAHNAYDLYAFDAATVLSVTSLSPADYYGLRTTNSGTTWSEPATFPDDKTITGVDFNGANGIMCSAGNYTADKIWVSSDSGLTWSGQYGLTNDAMLAVSFPTPSVAYMVGTNQASTEGRVWKSTNGGASWSDISSNLPGSTSPLRSVKFYDANLGWAGGQGEILYTTDGGSSWTSVDADIGYTSVLDIMMIVEYG